MRVTVTMTNDQGDRITIRQAAGPEPFHLERYRALNLPAKPVRTKIVRT
ncbi:MAG: hypothetical protein WHX93_02615 [bacterium]